MEQRFVSALDTGFTYVIRPTVVLALGFIELIKLVAVDLRDVAQRVRVKGFEGIAPHELRLDTDTRQAMSIDC